MSVWQRVLASGGAALFLVLMLVVRMAFKHGDFSAGPTLMVCLFLIAWPLAFAALSLFSVRMPAGLQDHPCAGCGKDVGFERDTCPQCTHEPGANQARVEGERLFGACPQCRQSTLTGNFAVATRTRCERCGQPFVVSGQKFYADNAQAPPAREVDTSNQLSRWTVAALLTPVVLVLGIGIAVVLQRILL